MKIRQRKEWTIRHFWVPPASSLGILQREKGESFEHWSTGTEWIDMQVMKVGEKNDGVGMYDPLSEIRNDGRDVQHDVNS